MENDPQTTILNVDDDDAGRYSISRTLRQAGFDVKEASNGREALRFAEEQPDLILLDVNLPDIGGFDVCRMIKNNPLTSHIPVLHLSVTYLDDEFKVKGLETADGYLTQPVEPPVLISTIKALLRMKWVEKELRKSEERFKQITENALEWIWEVDAQGLYTFASPMVRNILGYRPEEVVGIKHFYDFFHTEDRERLKKAAFEVFEGQRPFREFVNRNVHKDGETVWLSTSGVPFRDEKGNFLGYRGADTDITERKKAEEALRGSEEKYRSLFEESRDAISITTREGKFIDINQAWLELLGYTKEELISLNVQETYANPDDRPRVHKEIERKGFVRDYEIKLRKKDGTAIDSLLTFTLWRAYNGNILGYQGIIRDITERKRAEEALQFTRFSLDNAAETMVCVGHDGRFIDVNDAFCRSSGYSREELLSMTVHDIDPDYSAEIWPEFWEKLKQSGSLTFESCHRTKEGKVFPVEITANFFEYNGKEYHCSFARDITERKQAEKEIQNLAKFPSENPNPVLRIARDGTLLYVNEAGLRQLAELYLQVGQAAPPMLREVVFQAMENGSTQVFDIEHRERVYSFFVGPVVDAGYANLYGRDITERKRAEEERERLMADLEAKNRELEAFMYTISHDLRAPLVSLDGFSGALQKEYESQLGEEGRHYLERIRANVANMEALTTCLLDLSRIGQVVGSIEEIDVGPLLREIEEGLVLKLEQEGVEFIVQQPLPAVRGDRGRIRQVFANLIDNAVKFRSAERALRIEVGCQQESGFYRFHVADNGIGIAPQYHEQIFAPFRKLHSEIEGVGIGLALVKKIVEHHGGRAWVESEAGKGSTFYFTIPDRT